MINEINLLHTVVLIWCCTFKWLFSWKNADIEYWYWYCFSIFQIECWYWYFSISKSYWILNTSIFILYWSMLCLELCPKIKFKNQSKSFVQKVIEKIHRNVNKWSINSIYVRFWGSLALLGPFWLYLAFFDPKLYTFLRTDDGFNPTFRIFIQIIQCERHFFPQISGSERPQEVVWWHSLYKSSGRGYYCRAAGRSEILGDKSQS